MIYIKLRRVFTGPDIISQICSLHTPKECKKKFFFFLRTEDLNEKVDQTKKEGSYKSFLFL